MRYFFGELELNQDWFIKNIEKQIKNVKDKYNSVLHIENNIDYKINNFIGNDSFIISYKKERDKIIHHNNLLKNIDVSNMIILNEVSLNKLIYKKEELGIKIDKFVNLLDEYSGAIKIKNIENIDIAKINKEKSIIIDNINHLHDILNEVNYEEEKVNLDDLINELRIELYDLYEFIYNIVKKLNNLLLNDMHIHGRAGLGKTHLGCNICFKQIDNNKPAIMIHGKHISNNLPIEKQIMNILDVPDSYSWSDFLYTLQITAKTYETKIPIVIDALNESQNINKWKNEIAGLIYEINRCSNLILITTCRTSYYNYIWDTSKPETSLVIHGFDYDKIEHAIEKYFTYYKIRSNIVTPIKLFFDPLLLRIFCETKNKERKIIIDVFIGDLTLIEIFDEYIRKINRNLCFVDYP